MNIRAAKRHASHQLTQKISPKTHWISPEPERTQQLDTTARYKAQVQGQSRHGELDDWLEVIAELRKQTLH